MLKDNQEKLNSSIVEFMINSLDGRVHKQASTYTTKHASFELELVQNQVEALRERKVPTSGAQVYC